MISSAQIAKSADGGTTWTAIVGADNGTLGTLCFQSILADPDHPETVFVAGNPGVFVSTDAGQTWSRYDEDLPKASAGWLQWYGEYLYVSTWGRGLWRRQPFAQNGVDPVLNIRCQGKGRKERCTPLARSTTAVLNAWIEEEGSEPSKFLFPNARGGRLSADAVQHMVAKYVAAACKVCPSLAKKRVTPHVLRHTAAMELLQAGVDRSLIAIWHRRTRFLGKFVCIRVFSAP